MWWELIATEHTSGTHLHAQTKYRSSSPIKIFHFVAWFGTVLLISSSGEDCFHNRDEIPYAIITSVTRTGDSVRSYRAANQQQIIQLPSSAGFNMCAWESVSSTAPVADNLLVKRRWDTVPSCHAHSFEKCRVTEFIKPEKVFWLTNGTREPTFTWFIYTIWQRKCDIVPWSD